MRFPLAIVAMLLAGWCVPAGLRADEPPPAAEAIRAAIGKSIPLLEEGSRGSADQRQCFTCHNQALPVLALAAARDRGFAVDAENFARQLQHTTEHLERGRENYLQGRGQGGRVITAGYALWTLAADHRTSDETTSAVTHFLLEYQKDSDHWRHPGNRPPSSGSDFTTTYVALRGLADFGTDEQQPAIEARRKQVADWLAEAAPRDTEDRVFRLLALPQVEADAETVQQAAAELLDAQRDDGGWAQADGMQSDAYATATVLYALQRAGGVTVQHRAVCRGLRYLVETQLADGSWHVTTRAKPFQTYFESGFPHGKDQFISIAASSWATLVLAWALPEPVRGGETLPPRP